MAGETATSPLTEGFAVARKWLDHRADIQRGWHLIDIGAPVSRELAEDHAKMREVMACGRCETKVVPYVVEPEPEPVGDVVLEGQLGLFGGNQ